MKSYNVIGIDLAKNVLQVCKVNKHGKLTVNKAISPRKLKELLATSPPSIVAMEATQFGVRFSLIKDKEQQTLQTLETSRKFLDKELAALNNHIRAYVYEYGITINRGRKSLRETVILVLDDLDTRLPRCLKNTLRLLWERYQLTLAQLKETKKVKAALVKQIGPCKRLLALENVGEVCAAMLYANIGDGKELKNGREACACIGVTPKQHISGGKTHMMGSTKRVVIKTQGSFVSGSTVCHYTSTD